MSSTSLRGSVELDTRVSLRFALVVETPMIFMLRPRSSAGQWVSRESYRILPTTPVEEFTDPYGNLCQRLVAPPGDFLVEARAQVRVASTLQQAPGAPFMPVPSLPESTLQFLLPSRYCPSDLLGDRAQSLVTGRQPGYDQVAAICGWIHRNIAYRYGISNANTSALETLEQGAGVCRDFAHLAIALCRALSIPARMVMGFHPELPVPDIHAWLEAYVGGRWYSFDPTQAVTRPARVAVGYGRDAADVSIVTQFGPRADPLLEVEVRQGLEGAAYG